MVPTSVMSYSMDITTHDLRTPFERAFHCADVYDKINSRITPGTAVKLAQTCHAARDARTCFNRRAFNINRHLGRFFNDPVAFRSLQAQTGTLVSGSSALQFFDREIYEGSDLDVYLHPGHLERVGGWLMEEEGYTYMTEDPSTPVTPQPTLNNFEAFKMACTAMDRHIAYPSPVFNLNVRRPTDNPLSRTVRYLQPDVIQGCMTFVRDLGSQNQRLVQLMTTKYNPLDAILQFHSSE